MSKQNTPIVLFKRPIVLKSFVTPAFKREKEKELNKAVANCGQSVRQLTEHIQKNHLKAIIAHRAKNVKLAQRRFNFSI